MTKWQSLTRGTGFEECRVESVELRVVESNSKQKKIMSKKKNKQMTGEQAQAEDAKTNPVEDLQKQVEELKAQIAELNDKELRMMAEFDNYRRRTNKEKLELMETAGERIFKDMLPLVDDLERAMDAVQKSEDIEALKEGVNLIYSKFLSFLENNKVTVIDTTDADFNTDLHEAITTFAAGEEKKGKIIDCTQKGYKLGEKVIRFSKVVVGE